jgi:hypothetical protein
MNDNDQEPPIRAEPRLKLAGEPDEMQCPNCGLRFSLLDLSAVLWHDQAECLGVKR